MVRRTERCLGEEANFRVSLSARPRQPACRCRRDVRLSCNSTRWAPYRESGTTSGRIMLGLLGDAPLHDDQEHRGAARSDVCSPQLGAWRTSRSRSVIA